MAKRNALPGCDAPNCGVDAPVMVAMRGVGTFNLCYEHEYTDIRTLASNRMEN